jgi:hypothetical protein
VIPLLALAGDLTLLFDERILSRSTGKCFIVRASRSRATG